MLKLPVETNSQTDTDTIELKLQQSGLKENDLNALGYYRKTIFDFLETPSGSKLVDTIANLINNCNQKDHSKHTVETVTKLCCITAVVIATFTLSFYGKFDATTGLLFGSIIGYLFGKNVKPE